ncbi:hypothetical protein GmHk_13G036580 [Glycine max]|nr:hypothetical protein GmHk_13G036580 [Glycine max]
MVRTRGLGCALGRVIGRALGREDRHDSYDAPQQRRPTTSTRRQWEAALVVADEPVVAANVHAPGADPGHDAEGFLGGPHDQSVLTKYADHVAVSVWNRECLFNYTSIQERLELKLSSHGRKVQKLPENQITIMVRTRGLGCALGRVIGRALGREDRHDSYDAPQQRRPTTSTRRQREATLVVADEPVVAANVHAPGADPGHDAEGFPGGPRDPSVLTEYADHVAVSVWNREERPELKLSSHGRKVQKFGRYH